MKTTIYGLMLGCLLPLAGCGSTVATPTAAAPPGSLNAVDLNFVTYGHALVSFDVHEGQIAVERRRCRRSVRSQRPC